MKSIKTTYYRLINAAHAALAFICLMLCIMHIWVPRTLFNKTTSTVIMDRNGVLLGAIIADDEQWRFPSVDSIPHKYKTCIINYEDSRFEHHIGIDTKAIIRATIHNIKNKRIVEGGSSITMQLARMARDNQRRTIVQKCIEMLWALEIEMSHSKDDILNMYASNAPYGGNIVGIKAAAWRYYGRDENNLSWAENATLAVLPNSPAMIHVGRNRSALEKKRNMLLKRLRDRGILSEQEYELSISEPLPEIPYSIPNNAPHLMAHTVKSNKGKLVKTTIDGSLQTRIQTLADRYSLQYQSNYINDIAVLVAEVSTGNVIAYVGNSSHQSGTSYVDNIQSERSTGSLLKPILYAAMLTSGELTPKMLVNDTPLNINGFMPQNFNKSYSGAVAADVAIKRSLNVPLVRMLSDYNTGRFMTVLKWIGMTTLHYDDDHYGASLILGGAEGSLWDMTGMYASMSRILNNYPTYGYNYKTSDIHPLRLTTTEETPSKNTSTTMLSASAIWQAYEAMSGLNRPEEEADWQMFSSMKRVAWKTGTSWGNRDAWSIGTTSKYVVGVWVGNSTGQGRASMTGVGFAAPLMFDTFSMLDDSEWFEEPLDDMEQAIICRHSGRLASQICPLVDTLLVPRESVKTQVCGYCRLVHLTYDGQWQVNTSCESTTNFKTEARFVLPAVQEYYYKSHNTDYHTLPPFRADCANGITDQLAIIYPEHGSTVGIPVGLKGQKEKMVMKATCRDNNGILYWHLDDKYLGTTQTHHELAITPGSGQHTLTILDCNGNKKAILFTVK